MDALLLGEFGQWLKSVLFSILNVFLSETRVLGQVVRQSTLHHEDVLFSEFCVLRLWLFSLRIVRNSQIHLPVSFRIFIVEVSGAYSNHCCLKG